MRTFFSLAAITITAVLMFSCTESQLNEADFVTTMSNVCLVVDGKTLMEYDTATDQLAWREKDLQFRMMNDSLNDYFVVNMSTMPSEMGEVITAEVLYTTDSDVKSVSGYFNVSKISNTSSGQMIWLWNQTSKVAAIIQILR